jgi:hypothetical protein
MQFPLHIYRSYNTVNEYLATGSQQEPLSTQCSLISLLTPIILQSNIRCDFYLLKRDLTAPVYGHHILKPRCNLEYSTVLSCIQTYHIFLNYHVDHINCDMVPIHLRLFIIYHNRLSWNVNHNARHIPMACHQFLAPCSCYICQHKYYATYFQCTHYRT